MLQKKLLEKSFLTFKKWVEKIQTTGYNGALTVTVHCATYVNVIETSRETGLLCIFGQNVSLSPLREMFR